jgi:hypothetical protein
MEIREEIWQIMFQPVPESLWDNPEEKEVGKCIHEIRTILVDPESEESFWTLLHEIVHACLPDNDEHSVSWVEHSFKTICKKYQKHAII